MIDGVEYGCDGFNFNFVCKHWKKTFDSTRAFVKNGVRRIKVGDIRADLMHLYNSMSIYNR